MIGKLFALFFQIGLLSIGGGYAVIPMIRELVVSQQGWLSEKAFTDIITISQMTPGPLAVNTSTFVGMQIAQIPGAVTATAGCVIPGIAISLLLHGFFQKHSRSSYAVRVLTTLKAASLGLIVSAAAVVVLLTFFGNSDYRAVGIGDLEWKAAAVFAGALICTRKFKIGPILLMILSGILGLLIYI